MFFDFDVDQTEFCCGIGVISVEVYDEQCSVDYAAKVLRNSIAAIVSESIDIKKQFDSYDHYSTVLSTTAGDNKRSEFLTAVYKTAGFRKFGKSMKNYKTGKIVTKWYLDVPLSFKA